MFRRRLQIFLAILLLLAGSLLARAVQLQIVQHQDWEKQAHKSLNKSSPLETLRGRILDFKGRELAADVGCIDAAVDYRAIGRNPLWIASLAKARLLQKPELWSDLAHRKEHLADETRGVESDIDAMWATLARISGKTPGDIEQIKSDVVRRVELRRRSVLYSRYAEATEKHKHEEQGPAPWYRGWLLGDDSSSAPQLDNFEVTVKDEVSSHVILHAIDSDTYNKLAKQLARCPGLELKPSSHRVYDEPANFCAANLLGNLSAVNREDLQADPNLGRDDRRYYPNDLIGRSGLEALAEPLLRGSRGRQEHDVKDQLVETVPPVPGRDVRTTIDIDLQGQVMQVFENHQVHGAAVVIDVPTGQVRAMVSYPTFDLNRFEADYNELMADEINKPLWNRATMEAREPGSSVKPIIGSVAVTRGYVGVNEGIECTGYLVINGKTYTTAGRCWTMRQWKVGHHQTWPDPHVGHDGNPDGWLTVSDALERSCNVFFETVADRMGLAGVSEALHDFGLGEKTGVGIEEVAGRIPHFSSPAAYKRDTWFAGIGQGQVAATPIQMANVAATLARNGVWVRPTLLADPSDLEEARAWQHARQALEAVPAPSSRPTGHANSNPEGLPAALLPRASDARGSARPITSDIHLSFPRRTQDRVNLGISPIASAAVREGMIEVVDARGGTGILQPPVEGIVVAGKTGSAQAPKFTIPLKDSAGHDVKDANGVTVRESFEPGAFPWYQGVGTDNAFLAHAWYIGYAPADHPQIAFAVLVEYGGSGGNAAGPIARELLEACIEDGYLRGDIAPR